MGKKVYYNPKNNCEICGCKVRNYNAKKCKSCSNKENWKFKDRLAIGKKISFTKRITGVHRLEKNSNWKGGICSLIKILRGSYEYRQWRSDVFTRDGFTCQSCFKRGGDLEAHHIKMLSYIIKENKITTYEQALSCEEIWNINNGLTLCLSCHNETKTKYGNSI